MSNPDDPFADFDDSEATVLKPTPGGGRYAGAPPSDTPRPPSGERSTLPAARQGLNPLETAASSLLALVVGLKNTHSHPDPAGLHRQLIREIQAFEAHARRLGVGDEQTLTRARYALCATLDDIILNTPWGQQFGWSKKTLQGTFFRKEWAGDEFFKLLDKLLADPANHRDLLELMYICLALGFKGGYRLYDRQGELEQRRERLYRALHGLRSENEPALSPHWRGVTDQRNPVMRHVPLWVLAALAAVLLLAIYLFFNLRLNAQSDPVFTGLQAVRGDLATRPVSEDFRPPEPPPPPDDAHQGLRRELLAENCLDTGNVVIGQGDNRQVVGTFIRTNVNCSEVLFESAQWTVKPEFRQLLERVARILRDTLDRAPGQILITGHTDNIPGRFISNAELSQNRADAVRRVLVEELGSPGRFRAEGRGDREPVASNDTPEGRARNRRVEILVLYPHITI